MYSEKIPPPMVEMGISLRADFDIDVIKCDADGNPIAGTCRREVTACPNLFTNNGMDNIGSGAFLAFTNFLQVGTGNTAPANANTTLATFVAGIGAGGTGDNVWAWDTVNPKVLVYKRVYQFAAGAAAGALKELGMSTTATTGNLTTRALFKDPFGDPTTVNVAADEQLVVTYRVYFTASEVDNVFVTTQNGTEYTITTRPYGLGTLIGSVNNPPGRFGAFGARSDQAVAVSVAAYSGVTSGLAATTATAPAGTFNNISIPPRTHGTYVNGNYYRDDTLTIPLNTANVNDLGAVGTSGMPFCVQIGISPRINKTSNDTIKFTIRTTWSRG